MLKRIFNFTKISCSWLLAQMTGRPVHRGMPVAVSLEPVNLCNLRCPECPAGQRELTRQQGNMATGMFEEILEQLGPELAWVTLYFQGEPYLNPDFLQMTRVAKARNLKVVSSTNGHYLTAATANETVRSGLDKLIVSLDGATQESYSAYRTGGSLEKVIEGLKHLSEAKDSQGSATPRVVVQCLLLSSNIHEQEEIKRIAKEVRADKIEFKTAQFYDFENGNPLMPEEKYSRYKALRQQGNMPPPHYLTTSPPHHLT